MTTPNPTRALPAEPRQLAAWALVGYAGLHLVFAFFSWVLPDGATLGVRSVDAGFTSLAEIALPVLAVLIATGVHPQAKLIATVALLEYVVILLFGVLTLLIGLGVYGGSPRGGYNALVFFVLGLGRLALAAIAGLVVYQAWTRLGGSLAGLTASLGGSSTKPTGVSADQYPAATPPAQPPTD
jgi:hypothetical protein